ncbi:hypothetical protein FHT44_004972 [Mycolicibacterium sp. BK634]|uniref:hypothetical protein n=1 Tax=Mycolicibacterium sp. BK634 TaxID=2587099 RepID=UPI001618C628|nr:hypothetical protein [Mycolicibacterium sp. BK634]MBB3752460.1 hypothetical protein [Mycolicibacterium sp. BK634]
MIEFGDIVYELLEKATLQDAERREAIVRSALTQRVYEALLPHVDIREHCTCGTSGIDYVDHIADTAVQAFVDFLRNPFGAETS